MKELGINLRNYSSHSIFQSNDFITSVLISGISKNTNKNIYFIANSSKECSVLIEHLEQTFGNETYYLDNEILNSNPTENNKRNKLLNLLFFLGDNQKKIKFIDKDNLNFSFKENLNNKNLYINKKNSNQSRDNLIKNLTKMGYKDTEFTENFGEYSVRGSIIDIYPPNLSLPIRIEFYKDLVSSINEFHVEDGRRSSEEITQLCIADTRGGDALKNNSSIFDQIKDSIIILDYGLSLPIKVSQETLLRKKNKIIYLDPITKIKNTKEFIFSISQVEDKFVDSLSSLKKLTKSYDNQSLIITDKDTREKLKRDLGEDYSPKLQFLDGFLRKSFIMENFKTPVLSFSKARNSREKRKKFNIEAQTSFKLASFTDLSAGDLIVHKNFGLCIYNGLKNKIINNIPTDFIECEFSLKDLLLIPIDKINLIQKYIGGSKGKNLDTLRSKAWSIKVKRAKKIAQNTAKEILSLYAQRKSTNGFSFKMNQVEISEFENTFEYEETMDQKNAINETYMDMQKIKPMDRLICGDVGFGKTEIALRASYLSCINSKQTIVVAPTTLLAHQHFNTFSKRFKDFPVRVESISRFTKTKKLEETLADLSSGRIDILIGTHKALSEKIKLENLGLIIIDEEHKFGVSAKEKIKQLKKGVDSLSISATPIPRTLQLSLTGLREISLISTPPKERLSIETYIEIYNLKLIKKIISYELKREGRVFFIHNEINTIEKIYQDIKNIYPEEGVAYIHGQMKGEEVEIKLRSFIDGNIKILITTTIIEAGIDIKEANTMIINNAQNFGLSDLYQLRGRIGRGKEKGRAYLLIPNKDITQNAKKRLSAIRKLTKLGSGFNIALEDLEIRGAGNLFGTEQSGNIYDVGIEFYLDLLEKEIGKLKNNQQIESLETEVISQISFFIPRKYIESSETRLFYYKKISLVNKKGDSIKIIEELLDKFGTVPQEILNLICISEIKIECERLRVSKIILKKEALIMNIKKIGKITNAQIEIINFDAKPSETLEFLSKISKMEDILKSNYEIINDKFIINSRLLL